MSRRRSFGSVHSPSTTDQMREAGVDKQATKKDAARSTAFHVTLFALKILRHNTRIFKQAKSLVNAGYTVRVVGIRPADLPAWEERDGFDIVRLPPVRHFVTRTRDFISNVLVQSTILAGKLISNVWRFLLTILGDLYFLPNRIASFFIGKVKSLDEVAEDPVAWMAGHLGRIWKLVLHVFIPFLAVVKSLFHPLVWLVRALRRSLARFLRAAVRSLFHPLVWLTRTLRRPLVLLDYAWKGYRLYRKNPTPYVHCNDLDTLPLGCLVRFIHGARLVYDAQELYPDVHTLSRWERAFFQLLERSLSHVPDAVMAVNPFIADEMHHRNKIPRPTVLLNVPPMDGSIQRSGGVRERVGAGPGERIVLYSGGLTPRRGLEELVVATAQIEDAVLAVLGEGKLEGRLRAIARHHGVSDRVRFLKMVPHQEVPSLIASADCGVIPYKNTGLNHYYASPSKLFHYVMAGLPVAASDFPFLRSIVREEGIGVTFDSCRPTDMARAIREVLTPERNAAFRARLQEIRDEYAWEREEMKLLAVYRRLAE